MKIVSDGTTEGTRFLTESGERIYGVIGFSMHFTGHDDIVIAQMTIKVTEIDMHLDDTSIEVTELVKDVVDLEILEDWEDDDE